MGHASSDTGSVGHGSQPRAQQWPIYGACCRLDERPTGLGSFTALPCDSDGKLARFLDHGQAKTLLELHSLRQSPSLQG